MKKFTLVLVGIVGLFGLSQAQTSRTISEIPNTMNQPERTVQLPNAYFNATNPSVRDAVVGMFVSTEINYEAKIPFTGTYGTEGTNALLFDNGPHFNVAGSPNISMLQDSSLGMGTYGFAAHAGGPFSIADDFVLANDVNIDSIDFYGYQTGSTSPSINEVYVQIWDGDPSGSGSVIWGDMVTNLSGGTVLANTLRQLESAPGDTSRPLQVVTADTPGLSLSAGTYWVEFRFVGTGGSGPWAPPIVITGNATTGNGLHFNAGAWAALTDVGPQGVPFQIYGTEIASDGCDEENPNDFTFVNGINCSSASEFKSANDLTVAAGENFTLTHITASIFANDGITNVDVTYYDDAGGLPGVQIGQQNAVTIDSQSVIGTNFGFDVNEIKLSVNPFQFNGQSGMTTTYWIELSVTDGSSSGSVFWVVTSSSSVGNAAALFEGGWSIFDSTLDGVYIWEGECGTLGVADTELNSFTFYPNPTSAILHINAAKNIDSIAIYNMLGQEVISSKIGAVSSDINMSRLPAGTYLMKVSIHGVTKSYKIIKK